MSRFVRSSKYRHVYGEKSKVSYENAKISGSAWDTDVVSAGGKYIAVNWQVAGGGAFAVLPSFSAFSTPSPTGFPTKLPDILPLARGHTAPVLDTAWSPFDDNLVVSAGEDGKICIFKIQDSLFEGWGEEGWQPEELSPDGRLNSGGRKVGQVIFNPTASSVLASASGDYLVKLWDIDNGKDTASITLNGHKDIIQSIAWNAVGNVLATTCRDKKIRLYDPRAGAEAVRVADGHSGVKGSRLVWLGDRDRIVTTGFSRMSDRQLGLWDTSGLTNIEMNSLDSSAGVLMPFFTEGNDVLFLAGKGDGNIRYFEYENDSLHSLSEYKSAEPQRGMTFIPRRSLDVGQNEIARAFKLAGGAITPLSFMVPRKAESFQSDIFPPAPSAEPALNASEWFGGKTARPKMVDLETNQVSTNSDPVAAPPKASDSTPAKTEEKSSPAPSTPAAAASAAASAPPTPIASTPATPAPAAEKKKEEPEESEQSAKSLEIEQPESDDDDEPATPPAPTPATPGAPSKVGSVDVVDAVKPSSDLPKAEAVKTGQDSSKGSGSGGEVPVPKDKLLIKKLSPKATTPTRGSALSAGYDLYSAEDKTVPKRGKALVSTDLSVAVPEGTYGRVAPRSGLASKHSIDTGAGVIDADYRGEVRVLLYNFSDEDFEIKEGDRIAQLVLERIVLAPVMEVDDLDATARGAGGFGSTGGFGV